MTRFLKVQTKKLIRHFGYELVTEFTAREYLQAGNLRELFQRFEIGLALDVGANEGQYHDFLREQVAYVGPIVSFEPIPQLAGKLSDRALRDRNWEIRQFALGAAQGQATFNIADSSTISSFLPLAENMQHVRVVTIDDIPIETIDGLGPTLFENVPPERTFLKLDTQGYDLEVMKGATQYLERFPFLTTEIPFIKIYKGMPDFAEIYDYLNSRGFGLAGMWPTSRDALFRAREFDCLFVNSRVEQAKSRA